MKRPIIVVLLTLALLAGCSNFENSHGGEILEESILEKKVENIPSKVASSRVDYTDWLLPSRNSRMRTGTITHVMIHSTNNAARDPDDPYNLQEVYALFEEYDVSAHYMIDRDGIIYRLVPEERVAFHAGKGFMLNYQEYQNSFNDYSIGIELLAIGTKEEMSATIPTDIYSSLDNSFIGYTDAQYTSLNTLLDDITLRHPAIHRDREHIIGHDEYAPVRKTDPGVLFDWSRIGF